MREFDVFTNTAGSASVPFNSCSKFSKSVESIGATAFGSESFTGGIRSVMSKRRASRPELSAKRGVKMPTPFSALSSDLLR